MTFNNFKQLAIQINKDLGIEFCQEFQYKRKELARISRVPDRDNLFGNIKEDWAINKGGGIEIQYHISLNDDKTIKYGLGFNCEYVPFANKMSPVEYAQPYMDAFLQLKNSVETSLPDHSFVLGNIEQLKKAKKGMFILYGKSIPIDTDGQTITIEDKDYNILLEDQKRQFQPYIDIFKKRNELMVNVPMNNDLITLLKHKKQIILQGPPGTGKTYLAKEIARELTLENKSISIESNDIDKTLTVGLALRTLKEGYEFTITGIDTSIRIKVKSSNAEYTVSKDRVIRCVNNIDYAKKDTSGYEKNTGVYILAIAKFIAEENIKEQVKLVQFHPAYSYEDFVRGISVQSNETGTVEYLTKNRILVEIAERANQNYLDSIRDGQFLSKERWTQQKLEEFAEMIQDKIETESSFPINETVDIFGVERDAFRYTGKTWKNQNGIRMKFLDIIKLEMNNVQSRKEVKGMTNISGLAIEHASYYFKLLEKFRDFLKKQPAYVPKSEKSTLKNYVLIIDEINRANLASVLGELIYALEYRGEVVESMYELDGEKQLVLPPNLFIIGTMNTADRSVGHIDYAIRRRFAFASILPDIAVLKEVIQEASILNKATILFSEVEKIFSSESIAPDFNAEDVQIGHSYFLAQSEEELQLNLEYEIKPILREYLKDGILLNEVKEQIESLNV